MRNQEGKIKLQKKVHGRMSLKDITFLTAYPLSYVIFCPFLVYSLPVPRRYTCRMAPIIMPNKVRCNIITHSRNESFSLLNSVKWIV